MAEELYPRTDIVLPDMSDVEADIDALPEFQPIKIPKYREQIASQIALAYGSNFKESYDKALTNIETKGIDAVREEIDSIRSDRTRSMLWDRLQNYKSYTKEDLVSLLQMYESETKPKPKDYFATEKEVILSTAKPDIKLIDAEKATAELVAYNTKQELVREAAEEAGIWQKLDHFGKAFIPGYLTATYNKAMHKTLADLGSEPPALKWYTGLSADDGKAMTNMFRNIMADANPQQRDLILRNLYSNLKEEADIVGIPGVKSGPNYATVLAGLERAIETSYTEIEAEKWLNVVDAVSLVPGALYKTVSKAMIKAVSKVKEPVKILREELQNPELASNVVANDIAEKGQKSGMQPEEQMSSALSFGQVPYLSGHSVMEGLASDIKQVLQTQVSSEEAQAILNFRPKTGLTPDDIQDAVLKLKRDKYTGQDLYKADFGEADDIGQQVLAFWQHPSGRRFKSVKEAERFAKKREFEGETVKLEDGYVFKTETYHRWSISDVVPVLEQESHKIGWVRHLSRFIDPKQLVYKHTEDIRAISIHEEARLEKAFTKLLKDAYKGVSKEQAKLLDDTIKLGDSFSNVDGKAGKTFRPSELEAMGLEDNTINAYYKERNLRDIKWFVHNRAIATKLNYLGELSLKFKGSGSVPEFQNAGRTYDLKGAKVLYGQSPKGSRLVADLETGKIEHLSSNLIDQYYEKGYQLVRTYDPIRVGSEKIKYAFAKEGSVELKPWTTPLGYVDGTVGRVYTDPYFVTLKFRDKVGGDFIDDSYRTLRSSPTQKEALDFASKYNKALDLIKEFKKKYKGFEISETGKLTSKTGATAELKVAIEADATKLLHDMSEVIDDPELFLRDVSKGEIPLDSKFEVKFDRQPTELSSYKVNEHITHGRLFESQRGNRLLSVRGEYAPIKSPVSAMAQEMLFLSRYLSTEQWKVTEIERWLTSVGDNLLNRTGNDIEDFLSGQLKYPKNSPEWRMFDNQRKYIKAQAGIVPLEERATISKAQKVAEWIERMNLGETKLHKIALGFRGKSGAELLKSMNFQLTLGALALDQFFVQAAGAFVASAAHPVHGVTAWYTAPIYRLALATNSETAKLAYAKINTAMKLGFASEKEFLEAIDAIKKSGIIDSLRGTALRDVRDNGLDLGVSNLRLYDSSWDRTKALSKGAVKVGEQPFMQGEALMRLVAWDVSRRVWLSKNPGKAVNTRTAMSEIGEKADDFMLGMTRANKAPYQEGWLGVPFQFNQYPFKFATSLMGRQSFTGREKFNIVAGQVLLYGAAGAPGLDWAVNKILGEDTAKFTEIQVQTIKQGILAGMIKATLGEDVAVGTRLGMGEVIERFYKGFFDEEFTMREFAFGASGNKAMSFLDRMHQVAFVSKIPSDEDMKDTLVLEALSEIPKMASSWDRMSKAMYALGTDNMIRTRKGTPIAQISDRAWVFKAFGFQNQSEIDTWKAKDYMKAYAKAESDFAATLVRLQLDELKAIQADDHEARKKAVNNRTVFLSAFEYSQRLRINNMAMKRLQSEPEHEKILRDIALKTSGELEDSVLKMKQVFGLQ